MIGFVHRVGKDIHDIHDQPFILEGVGIGSWLLQEGYMLQSFDSIDRPRRFRDWINAVAGEEYVSTFYTQWYKRFFTAQDVHLIKDKGFNSIRIPIDYQVLFEASDSIITLPVKEQNMSLLDYIIATCSQAGVYVILDLHGAPGGQTGTNIDNSKHDHPDLFTNTMYQDQLCYIWKTIAKRYRNTPFIAAYDLLNEPLPNWFSQYNDKLVPLYKRIIVSIREVDPHHMITLEGLHWSTDWSCFKDILDENILFQFHKYWNNPDKESIQEYLDFRTEWNVPIYMGEGGENNLQWYVALFQLLEQYNISYNMWTYKKMESHNSIVSFSKPIGWDSLLKVDSHQPGAITVLNQLLDAILFQNTTINYDVIRHILRQDDITIPAFAYDHYGQNKSFYSIGSTKSSLRQSDHLILANQLGERIPPNFKQYSGEDYTDENRIGLTLRPGEWIHYSVYTTNDYAEPKAIIKANDSSYIESTWTYGTRLFGQNRFRTKHLLKVKAIKLVTILYIEIKTSTQ